MEPCEPLNIFEPVASEASLELGTAGWLQAMEVRHMPGTCTALTWEKCAETYVTLGFMMRDDRGSGGADMAHAYLET